MERITESKLQEIIASAINEAIQEEMENEGFMNNLKAGWNTFTSDSNKGSGIKNRFNNAKQNFKLQGQYDELKGLRDQLRQYISNGSIDPNMTVAQLANDRGRGGMSQMSGKLGRIGSQMSRNGAGAVK